MDPAAKQPVRVTILNQTYTLVSQGDPSELHEAAQQVDDLLNSIVRKAPTADTARIAVLGCLHLADRLRSLERDLNALKSRIDHKSEEFALLLESVIESPKS